MSILSKMSLKTQAMVATAGILLLVLAFNTLTTIYVTTGKYRDALIAKTTVLADGIKKDINKAIGFGLPLSALEAWETSCVC